MLSRPWMSLGIPNLIGKLWIFWLKWRTGHRPWSLLVLLKGQVRNLSRLVHHLTNKFNPELRTTRADINVSMKRVQNRRWGMVLFGSHLWRPVISEIHPPISKLFLSLLLLLSISCCYVDKALMISGKEKHLCLKLWNGQIGSKIKNKNEIKISFENKYINYSLNFEI